MRFPLTIAIAAALLVTAALAIEPPKEKPATPAPPASAPAPPPAPAEPAEPPADAPPAQAQAEPEEELEELPPLPPDVVDTGPPPQRFTPTEKVRADFPVSYPIDI